MAKCEWRDPVDSEYRCALEAAGGKSLCIFHTPEEKDVDEFKRRLYAQLDCQDPDSERNSRYDFRGYVFPVGIRVGEDRVAADVVVLPRVIDGDVNFGCATIEADTDFADARIEGHVNFGGVTVKGNLLFWRAVIEGDVHCGGAAIEGDADFSEATVNGAVVFDHATIKGNVICWGATIACASCWGAAIEGDADFGDATIEGAADLLDARIKGCANFTRAMIGEDVRLGGVIVGADVGFECAKVEGIISFAGAEVGGMVYFIATDAGGILLREGTPTIMPTFRWSGRSLANRCGVMFHDLAAAHEFWRFAERMFEKEGARERADAAFYFSRLTRLSPWRVKREGTWKEQATQIIRRIGMLPGWVADCLFLRWPIGYGASLSRTITSWFTIIGGFAIMYATVPGALGGPREALWTASNWSRALYLSVSAFLTLGIGAVEEIGNLGRTLIAVERVLGALLMALTVAVVTRKFMR